MNEKSNFHLLSFTIKAMPQSSIRNENEIYISQQTRSNFFAQVNAIYHQCRTMKHNMHCHIDLSLRRKSHSFQHCIRQMIQHHNFNGKSWWHFVCIGDMIIINLWNWIDCHLWIEMLICKEMSLWKLSFENRQITWNERKVEHVDAYMSECVFHIIYRLKVLKFRKTIPLVYFYNYGFSITVFMQTSITSRYFLCFILINFPL